MRRFIGLAFVLATLAACGGGGGGDAPRFLDDACAIARDKPDYMSAFRAVERKWGVPVHVQMATIHQESKFVSDARTPLQYAIGVIPVGRQSSAFGYSQALDGTWDEYRSAQRRPRARRDRIRDATDFMGWYMSLSRQELGIPLHDARNQYLAYHDGRSGYRRGTWKAKPWLIRVSGNVAVRAEMYRQQLPYCR